MSILLRNSCMSHCLSSENKNVTSAAFRFSGKNLYYVVSFNQNVPTKMYEVAPAAWFVTEELVWFPTSYNRWKLEKAVEKGGKPLPKKEFKQFTVNVLFETGTRCVSNPIRVTFYPFELFFNINMSFQTT